MVFVTTGTGSTTKTADVYGAGFYYYSSADTKWVKVGGGATLYPLFLNVRELTNTTFVLDPLGVPDNVIIISIAGTQSITFPPAPATNGRVIYVRNNSVDAGGAGLYNWIGPNAPVSNTTLVQLRSAA